MEVPLFELYDICPPEFTTILPPRAMVRATLPVFQLSLPELRTSTPALVAALLISTVLLLPMITRELASGTQLQDVPVKPPVDQVDPVLKSPLAIE